VRIVKANHSATISKMDFISRDFVMDRSIPRVYPHSLWGLAWVVCVALLVLIATDSKAGVGAVAHQKPLPELTAIEVDHTSEDLRVKAFGSDIVIFREFLGRNWKWNRNWSNISVAQREGRFDYDWNVPPAPHTFGRGSGITRNETRFLRVGSGIVDDLSKLVFKPAGSSVKETFTINDTHAMWRDTEGNWIEYKLKETVPNNGVIASYGNDLYRHRLALDSHDRVQSVIDHFDNALVTFYYLGESDLPTRIEDYSGRSVQYLYNDEKQLIEFVDVRGESWKYTYTEVPNSVTSKPRVASVEDPRGNVTSYEYTNNSTTVIEADGLKTVYIYQYDPSTSRIIRTEEKPDGTFRKTIKDNTSNFGATPKFQEFINGELVSRRFGDQTDYEIENEAGERTRYRTSQFNKLTSITYPDSSQEKWVYSSDGQRRVAYVDRNGSHTEWEYDDKGRVTEMREAVGKPEQVVTRYSYPGLLTRITTRLGDAYTPASVVTETFDQYGNVVELMDAESNAFSYTYNALGQVLTEKKPSGARYVYEYDAAGNLTKATDPLGRITSSAYDAAGNLQATTWPNQATTKYSFNALNRQVGTTNARNETVETIYDRASRTFTIKDAKGAQTKVQMNARGLPIVIEDPNGNQTRQTYDNGRLVSTQHPTFEQTYEYAPGSRLKRITDQYDGKKSSTGLKVDPLGQVIEQIDANNNPEHRQYDAFGRLAKITDALGGITRLTYDVHGNLVNVTDPEGRETRFEYNGNGQVTAEERQPTPSQVSRRSYQYDADGNLATGITPTGEKTVYSYNGAGELVTIELFVDQSNETPEQTISLTYNTLGQVTSYDDGETRGTYSYDKVGQMLTATTDYGPFAKSISYTYDAAGDIATYTNPEGVTYTYNYDGSGLIRSINIPGTGVVAFSEYEWIQPTRITLPGGSVIERQYDGLQRMSSNTLMDPAQNALTTVLYGYDPVGNILSQGTEHGDYTYGYDNLYRLTEADYPAANDETFEYDGVGNRTGHNGDSSWTYNEANQLTQQGDTSYEHDANGHLIKKTVMGQDTHFVYNSQERLVRVEGHNRQIVASYGYNPLGHRLWKEVNGERTYFFYNESGLVGEYHEDGTLIKEYQYTPDSTWMTNPLFLRSDGQFYFYQTDHSGTPKRLVATSGQVVWEARSEAFGNTEEAVAALANNLRFPGQYFDAETGFYHNYFRDYDPELGRYIQEDPVGLSGGINMYVYASSNPISNYDPLGLTFKNQYKTANSVEECRVIYDQNAEDILDEAVRGCDPGDSVKDYRNCIMEKAVWQFARDDLNERGLENCVKRCLIEERNKNKVIERQKKQREIDETVLKLKKIHERYRDNS